MIQAPRFNTLAAAGMLSAGLLLSSGAQALATWSASGCKTDDTTTGAVDFNYNNLNGGRSAAPVSGFTTKVTASGASGTSTVYAGNACTLSSATDGNLTVSAWSNTQGGTVGAGNVSTNGKFESAQLMGYDGGFGVKNRGAADNRDLNESGTPEHAVDNNGFTDGVMLSFTQSTILRSVSVGYYDTDSDLSVLAYMGAGAPVMTGKSVSDLLANGWVLVSNLTDVTGTRSFNSGAVGVATQSSYWFVSAYNQGFGGGFTNSNDHFKLSAFSGETGGGGDHQVSEPAGLALAGLALLGVWGGRRRRS